MDKEYRLLKGMLEVNRQLYRKGHFEFLEYLDNHEVITNKLKNSILSYEQFEILKLIEIDDEVCLKNFNIGISILKLNYN